MYAVVDIETTGGFAADNRIIEIAIAIFDGEKIIDFFESTVNPQRMIPQYISGFTGISQKTADKSPTFQQIASKVFNYLQDKTFVAHNVNFDYSFVKNELFLAGFKLESRKLCTVRYARKVFPGLRSYNLSALSHSLNVNLFNAHRAGSDCKATAEILGILMQHDTEKHLTELLKKGSTNLRLPPNIDKNHYDKIPELPGVYYFSDANNQVIYVGKAINLKKRIDSHFGSNNLSENKQRLLREVHQITYELCGNELVALLHELHQIKQLWPKYNRAQKSTDKRFALYHYMDGNGIINLAVEKHLKFRKSLLTFSGIWDARTFLEHLCNDFSLSKQYCGLEHSGEGKMLSGEAVAFYNHKVNHALESLNLVKESFVIAANGREFDESAIILVHQGVYVGYTFFSGDLNSLSLSDALELITPVSYYPDAYWMIKSYIKRNQFLRILRFEQVEAL
jgi:DNA polymerase-3 subunit epsilon